MQTSRRWNHVRRQRPHVAAVLALGVLGLGVVPLVAGTAPASAATSKGCTSSSPGSTTLTLKVNGFTRTVIVHVPKRSTNTTPLALVLNLHGSGSTALAQEKFTGMDRASNSDGFIVAYPQGLIPDGLGFDWNVPGVALYGGRPVPPKSANDVKFLTALVGIMESKYCVNANEVYATGFSGGARESSQLACDDATLFAAVAPVSGLRRASPCPTTRAVPIITFHGTADPVDPYTGHGQKYWTYSVAQAAKYWSSQDSCTTKASSTPVSGVTLLTYAGCANGAEVEFYSVIGEGHEWPGGPTVSPALTSILGPQSDLIDANALMWAFFQAHPLA